MLRAGNKRRHAERIIDPRRRRDSCDLRELPDGLATQPTPSNASCCKSGRRC